MHVFGKWEKKLRIQGKHMWIQGEHEKFWTDSNLSSRSWHWCYPLHHHAAASHINTTFKFHICLKVKGFQKYLVCVSLVSSHARITVYNQPLVFSFILQSLSPVRKVLRSWATTMAQYLRRIQGHHAWSGPSFLIMCSSTLAVAWESTITAETLTVNPTPGAFSDRAPVPLAGLTVTATRVR